MTGEWDDPESGPAPSVRAAVERSLPDLPRLPRDDAAVAAVRLYASLLDDAVDRLRDAAEDGETQHFARMVNAVSKVGPRLERMFDLLGMAPGARPVLPKDPTDASTDPAENALARLRTGRPAPGFDPSAFVDPSVEEADPGD